MKPALTWQGGEDGYLALLDQTLLPGEQKVLFTGVTHAREWATHELVLYLAETLTAGSFALHRG